MVETLKFLDSITITRAKECLNTDGYHRYCDSKKSFEAGLDRSSKAGLDTGSKTNSETGQTRGPER